MLKKNPNCYKPWHSWTLDAIKYNIIIAANDKQMILLANEDTKKIFKFVLFKSTFTVTQFISLAKKQVILWVPKSIYYKKEQRSAINRLIKFLEEKKHQ